MLQHPEPKQVLYLDYPLGDSRDAPEVIEYVARMFSERGLPVVFSFCGIAYEFNGTETVPECLEKWRYRYHVSMDLDD